MPGHHLASHLSAAATALADHLTLHALRTDGPFTLRSGEQSSWYLDARRTTFDGGGAVLVADAVIEALDDAATAVGGMTMGADPIAVAVAVESARRGRSLRAFSVRKKAKGHGAGGRLVGPVVVADRAVVVEDTTTTGTAMLEAVDVLVGAGITVIQGLALVDRSDGAVAGRFAARNIPFRALLTPPDLGVAGR